MSVSINKEQENISGTYTSGTNGFFGDTAPQVVNTQSESSGNDAPRRSFGKRLGEFFYRSFHNGFVIKHRGEKIISVPLFFAVLIALASLEYVRPFFIILIAAMFFNVSYGFDGEQLGGSRINAVLDKIAEGISNFKRSLLHGA